MKAEMTDKEKRWEQALREVHGAMDDANLPFFLDTGTLLGAVRDKRFISWDNDIDLGILKTPGTDKKILQVTRRLHANGYSYFRSIKAVYFMRSPDIEIGIMFYEKTDKYYRNEFRKVIHKYGVFSNIVFMLRAMNSGFVVDYDGHSFGKKIKRIVIKSLARKPFREERQFSLLFDLQIKEIKIPREFFDNLAPLDLYGATYLAPAPTGEYLETRYGKGWSTPISNYNYFEEDRSAQD